MSMVKCHDCDRIVDAKSGEGDFVELGHINRNWDTEEVFLCEFCLDMRSEDWEREATEVSEALEEAERQGESNAKN